MKTLFRLLPAFHGEKLGRRRMAEQRIRNIAALSLFIFVMLMISLSSSLPTAWAGVLLTEDFEDNVLDNRISILTNGTFNSANGIKNITTFGSTKAFGFGRSTCSSDCWGNFKTTMKITFPEPIYISSITFKDIELYGNSGSNGVITLDGAAIPPNHSDFGRSPYNDNIADTAFRYNTFSIAKSITTIEIIVEDMTGASEILIDDLQIIGGAPGGNGIWGTMVWGQDVWYIARGSLKGQIITSITGQPTNIVGATVILVGTGASTTTNSQGQYEFNNVSVGTYTLKVEHANFQPFTIQNVAIAGGQTLTLESKEMTAPACGEGMYTKEQLDQTINDALKEFDPDGNRKIGLIEAIHALQVSTGQRP